MENIKLLRIKMHLKQTDVAKLCNVSPSTYRRWEGGRGEPTYSQLRLLANAFGLPHDRFFRFLEGNGIR